MRLRDIEFDQEELLSLQSFLPRTPGARLLERVIEKVEAHYQTLALSRQGTMETVRAGQGAIEAINTFVDIVAELAEADWEQLEREKRKVEDEIRTEEERVDVAY